MLTNRQLEEFSPEMWEWMNKKPVQECPECGGHNVQPLWSFEIESAINQLPDGFGAAYG